MSDITAQGQTTAEAQEKIERLELERERRKYAALTEVVKSFGEEFEPFLPSDKTDLIAYMSTFERDNAPPPNVHPWECRIGLSRFLVPPINLSMTRTSQIANIGGGLRAGSTPKFNSGHSESVLSLTLYFPTHESIWGFEGTKAEIDFDHDSEEVIDRYMSSLRGLVTQFKYAPFLPIKNTAINQNMGIDSVALQSMQVSTVDGFPFALAVQLNLLKFNHEVFLPMVPSMDNAIHWGKFRQYMGRGAAKLNAITDKNFLTGIAADDALQVEMEEDSLVAKIRERRRESGLTESGTVKFNKARDFTDGKNFDLFYPAHTPARVAYPDLTAFRSEEDTEAKKKNLWQQMLGSFGFDYSTSIEYGYENYTSYWAGVDGSKYLRDESRLLDRYLDLAKLTYDNMGPDKMESYIEQRLADYLKEHPNASDSTLAEVEQKVKGAWFSSIYNAWVSDPLLEKEFAYQQFMNTNLLIREWEVPMEQLGIDNATCFVQSVSVSMANNLARMQIQMEEEPAFQHLGALDTTAQISMIIFSENDGQDALTKFTRAIEHVNGLARLEHGHGVLGFFGIKNVITTLCGMKYCMLQQMTTESIDNQPNAYRVNLSFVDFDVFQQKRELLSSEQQEDLIEAFSKRNPFLRIKQHWAAFNAYPDFPLSVRDKNGKVLGHLDPDYYFKAFDTIDGQYVDFDNYDPVGHYTMMADGEEGADQAEGGGTASGVTLSKGGVEFWDGKNSPVGGKMNFWEMNADQAPAGKGYMPGFTPLALYQAPYIDSKPNPQAQFQSMLRDAKYRDKAGRMIRAYPTYMLWLIDEGGNFAGVKLFDNFYGLQSVVDIALSRSEDSMDDTLILQVSNLYSRLSTEYRDLLDEDVYANAKIINTMINRNRNLVSGTTDELISLDTIDMKPGVRIHLRMGYSANPNNLETVFNGTVTEVTEGEVMTLVCQSDTAELSAIINAKDEKGNTGKIDGSLFGSLNFSEPRDLMVRLMTMGGSTVREAISHATRGKIFSENRFGIRHFGVILTDSMTDNEKKLTDLRHSFVGKITNSLMNPTGTALQTGVSQVYGGESLASQSLAGANSLNLGVFDLFTTAVTNMSKDRNYELFKRNIYPGNGTGITQYMGGDLGDGGVAMGFADTGLTEDGQAFTLDPPKTPKEILGSGGITGIAGGAFGLVAPGGTAITNLTNGGDLFGWDSIPGGTYLKGVTHPFTNMLGLTNESQDDDVHGADEVSFRASTYMKSVWDIFQTCAALLPNYIVAVRPFEDRSTVFYGKPHWNWTSSVIPVTKGIPSVEISAPDEASNLIMKGLLEQLAKEKESDADFYKRISESTGGGSTDPGSTTTGMAWDGRDIGTLPLEAPGIGGGKAYIPVRSGKMGMEMHLPTDYNLAKDIGQHKQISGLPAQYSHPFYMDRSETGGADGAQGGVGGVDGNNDYSPTGTIKKGDRPEWPGRGGTWGALDPDSEQWYIAMRWAYTSSHGAEKKGDCTASSYRKDGKGKKILVYNNRSKKGCICTPGDFGPSGWVDKVGGFSPDVAFTLDHQPEDTYNFGFVEDDKPLGPVSFDGTTPTSSNVPSSSGSGTTSVAGKPDASSGDLPSFMMSDFALSKRGKDDSVSHYTLAWGWKDNNVPVDYTDPNTGLVDEYGQKAAEVYGEADKDIADSVWTEFRNNFRGEGTVKDVYNQAYPQAALSSGNDNIKKRNEKIYNEIMDQFVMFMWRNPFHRGWLVLSVDLQVTPGTLVTDDASGVVEWFADKVDGVPVVGNPVSGLVDTLNPFDDAGNIIDSLLPGDDKKWNFHHMHRIWALWLGDPSGQKAIEYMIDNMDRGKREGGLIGRGIEEFKQKIWDKLADIWNKLWDVAGAILSGVVNMLRLSMMLMNGGVQMSTFEQKQANILNKVYNDSIYYAAGPPGSLSYYVDNPFTREYHEPVIEVREPFQKLHLLSSFTNIIDNKVTEFSGVPTVVNATSGGGHPVTVTFDKGAPSDKQIETSIETGLAWATNPGWKNMALGLINPVQLVGNASRILQNFSTHFNNGDQETSAKRVALWFLKEGLKDIYGGEIIIIGDPSIRPHDLIYIADVYSRIYGMAEVEQVVHHFNAEMGFVTSITPNAIVTINDPARWSMTEMMRQRLNSWQLRGALRAKFNKADRGGYGLPPAITMNELVKASETNVMGSLSYTGGNTALVKDFAASVQTGGLVRDAGPDDLPSTGINGLWDIASGSTSDFLDSKNTPIQAATVGAKIGSIAPGIGPVVGAFAGWKAWSWVKNNLMDQQSCYIQYLNKDGKPMDGGLSFNRGVAVGQQRTSTLFKDSLRLQIPFKDENGNAMISRDDLLSELGWSGKDIADITGELDLYTNQTLAKIYDLAGRPTPDLPPNGKYKAFWVKIEDYKKDGVTRTGVDDGDTIRISGDVGGFDTLRLAGIDAPEMPKFLHGQPDLALTMEPDELGTRSFLWLYERMKELTQDYNNEFAIRVNLDENGDPEVDLYGYRVLAWIFANPGEQGLDKETRKDRLMAWANSPYASWDGYQAGGAPYTVNWESVLVGNSNVYLYGLNSDLVDEGASGGVTSGNQQEGGN